MAVKPPPLVEVLLFESVGPWASPKGSLEADARGALIVSALGTRQVAASDLRRLPPGSATLGISLNILSAPTHST